MENAAADAISPASESGNAAGHRINILGVICFLYPVLDARKSYWIPAAETFGFDFLLNEVDRHFVGDEYKSNWSSIRHNAGTSWHTDSDPFTVNQLGHPYQGSMYYGFARSAGLTYWESLGYKVTGSAFWECAGETTPPSFNDQITMGFGGSFLGEALLLRQRP